MHKKWYWFSLSTVHVINKWWSYVSFMASREVVTHSAEPPEFNDICSYSKDIFTKGFSFEIYVEEISNLSCNKI